WHTRCLIRLRLRYAVRLRNEREADEPDQRSERRSRMMFDTSTYFAPPGMTSSPFGPQGLFGYPHGQPGIFHGQQGYVPGQQGYAPGRLGSLGVPGSAPPVPWPTLGQSPFAGFPPTPFAGFPPSPFAQSPYGLGAPGLPIAQGLSGWLGQSPI